MRRILLAGLLLAVLVIGLAAASRLIALDTVWPILLAAGVALVPGGATMTRVGALLAGAAAGWLGFAVRVGVLPDVPVAQGLGLAVAVLVVTAVAVATADRVPLWAGLAGVAIFSGMYEAAFRADPAAFVADSTVAFTSVLLAAALGAAAGMIASAVTATGPIPVIDAAEPAQEAI